MCWYPRSGYRCHKKQRGLVGSLQRASHIADFQALDARWRRYSRKSASVRFERNTDHALLNSLLKMALFANPAAIVAAHPLYRPWWSKNASKDRGTSP